MVSFKLERLVNNMTTQETMGLRIKSLREEKKMSQTALAELVGYKDKTAIAKVEAGKVDLPQSKISAFANALNTTTSFLFADTPLDETYQAEISNTPKAKGVKINVLGRVAAGLPIEAIENIIDTEEISEEMARTGEFFGLQIKGDSMEPRIYENDVVIVRKQDDAESGDIVIALVNGNDATCKRLIKYAGGISLVSLNSAKYEPLMFSNEDILEMYSKLSKLKNLIFEFEDRFNKKS